MVGKRRENTKRKGIEGKKECRGEKKIEGGEGEERKGGK